MVARAPPERAERPPQQRNGDLARLLEDPGTKIDAAERTAGQPRQVALEVRRAIRSAIRRVARSDPALGLHLERRSARHHCSYRGSAERPIDGPSRASKGEDHGAADRHRPLAPLAPAFAGLPGDPMRARRDRDRHRPRSRRVRPRGSPLGDPRPRRRQCHGRAPRLTIASSPTPPCGFPERSRPAGSSSVPRQKNDLVRVELSGPLPDLSHRCRSSSSSATPIAGD